MKMGGVSYLPERSPLPEKLIERWDEMSKARDRDVEIRVLIVDDELSLRYTLKEVLLQEGYTVDLAENGISALSILDQFEPHLAIVDYSMPKMNGLDLLKKMKQRRPELIVIMMTAYGTEEIAVEAMKAGAHDYFAKPFNNDEMLIRLASAAERLELEEENRQLKKSVSALRSSPVLLWKSQAMAEVEKIIAQIAETDVTVLVSGESGTGKELVATSIHRRSNRSNSSFVKLNCAALPETLIESELFGYDIGAFTGAVGNRKGKFEQANGGTIFLDEIGDMTLATQTKVLRVLQEREFERLGGAKTIKVDVRIIAATHQDLEQKIAQGEFREDLYYRLNVVKLDLPPLRKRKEDIEILAKHFIDVYSQRFGKESPSLPKAVLDRMKICSWPGNVRELENSIARAVVLDSFEKLLPDESTNSDSVNDGALPTELFELPYKEAKAKLLESFERRYVIGMLDSAEQNVSKAAKMAGMHRKNFWEKLQKYQGEEEEE